MGGAGPADVSAFRPCNFFTDDPRVWDGAPSMSHVTIRDDRLNRTVPVESTTGTIEIDLSGTENTIVLPAEASLTVEYR